MSDADTPDTADGDNPPEVDPDELIQQAAEHKQEQDEKHATLLEAAAEGEEAVFSDTETVELGETEITAETQIPGSVMRQLDAIYEDDLSPGKALDVYVDVLTAQTVSVAVPDSGVEVDSESDVRAFWRGWIDSHDAEAAAQLALERVIEMPNDLEDSRRRDAVESFRSPETRGQRGGTR